MQSLLSLLPAAALVGAAAIHPSPTTVKAAAAAQPAATTTTAAASGNPFSGYQLYANPYYSSEVISEAIPSLSATSLAAAASKVAEVPSFFWMYAFTES